MLTREEDERLTRVGPGSSMGELLRRYWHPIAASSDLVNHPTKAVRILGESLVPQWSLLDNNSGQDIAMWYTPQGPIADRSLEKLGESDRGIVLYRELLEQQMKKVQRGEDPMNVFRDPAKNVSIKLRVEEAKLAGGRFRPGPGRQGGVTKYSPIFNEEASCKAKVTQVPTGSNTATFASADKSREAP